MFIKLLILVHPGSLCGSANFNLGRSRASEVRLNVIDNLLGWEGGVLVLDGVLSDELPHFPALDCAIGVALERGAARGLGIRLEADDPEHSEIARRFVVEHKLPVDAEIALTGAWYDPSNQHGCVNGVLHALAAAGYERVRVLESAASLDDEAADEWDEDADADALNATLDVTLSRPA